MISARIQIENGQIKDMLKGWGFIPMKSSKRFAPPEKKREKTSYAEKAGTHEDLRTVDDEFDYTMMILIEAPNRNFVNANSKIAAWNNAIRDRTAGSDIKRCKRVTLYNDYMRCKITGIPEVMAEVDDNDFYRRQDGSVMDCVVAKLVIHVDNPDLCDFDTCVYEMSDGDMPIRISLRTNGHDVFIDTSRTLGENEIPVLLTRGVRTNGWPGSRARWRSRYRWHAQNPLLIIHHQQMRLPVGKISEEGVFLNAIFSGTKDVINLLGYVSTTEKIYGKSKWGIKNPNEFHAWRAYKCWYKLPASRPECMITYGVAIYSPKDQERISPERLSNVAYFRMKFNNKSDTFEVEV